MNLLDKVFEFYRLDSPSPYERARGQRRGFATIAAIGTLGAIAWVSGSNAAIVNENPVMTLNSNEGPIQCVGEKSASMATVGSVSELVAERTVFVTNLNSFVTPDLEPVVAKVLELNGIADPTAVSKNAVLTVPDWCGFASE